ncbi:aspartate mitochondrial [Chlorella sorokiniana]|uniref:Aspartate aminotransferase n=1 Tax=Chlorella sorokiniana TaxID=3076 RepID=A0A2P6TQN7_CHLSO|nr:aspartate mitochondrial [Chlorella sorokiniana]|eukprot:PRW56337.1 aspartate mitochondrial [Chlorella sorokiniana]
MEGLIRQAVVPLLQQQARGFASRAAGFWCDSWFSHVPEAPRDPILGVTEKFLADTNPQKINLGVGAYRDDSGQPVVLKSVREAERRVAGSHFMEYLPIAGHRQFCEDSVKLAYGEDSPVLKNKQVAMLQSLSGTGSCRLSAEFQGHWLPGSTIYIPTPTWANHLNIWRDAHVAIEQYPYYKPETRGLDFERMCDFLSKAPAGSAVLLHACAHNPTGVDPTTEQWRELSKLLKAKTLLPILDCAYQGFASGDCDRDAQAIRIFAEDGHRMMLCQSFAKNMGLYGQRVGCWSIVCEDEKEAKAVESQMKALARPMYSNPPLFGALLVHNILADKALKQQWLGEVKEMAERIISMRTLLRQNLEALGSPLSWNHITDQIGMFCYTGLAPEQVDKLTAEHSIYLTRNGRISMAGVNTNNVARLAEAIHKWGLKAFCIACAKFQEGDTLGEALAVAATAPYFAIYHAAVLLHARRELHMALVMLGLLLTSALCTVIKKALKQPRPAATCALLGNCHKHGMPSSHSAVMAFAATTALLLYLHRRGSGSNRSRGGRNGSGSGSAGAKDTAAARTAQRGTAAAAAVERLAQALPLLEVVLLLLLTAAVAYGRVHLGYHSPAQVAAGLALGSSLAAAWWRLTLTACERWGPALLRLPLLRALHFRDSLGCLDVHAAEADLLKAGPAAKRSD